MNRFLGFVCGLLVVTLVGLEAGAAVQRKKFSSANGYLIVEVLDDDLVHFEVSAAGTGPTTAQPLYTSPMVSKTQYPGASSFVDSGTTLETAELRIEVDAQTLAVSVRDKTQGNALLTRIEPRDLNQALKRLEIDPASMRNVYGLGQQFKRLGLADGDWKAHGKREGGPFGNTFDDFQLAKVGNVQIPILYAIGTQPIGYALFLDNVYRQTWDFTQPKWQVRTFGDQLRFYVLGGPTLLDLRHDYLELTGEPPIPPRNAFGLWVSEFGYDNFDQLKALRNGLRQHHFPVDGFVLDLNWFGGVVPHQPAKSQMGRLDWDQSNTDGNPYFFPNPDAEIKAFSDDGLGLAVIEESYVAEPTSTYQAMPAQRMVYQRTNGACAAGNQGTPVELDESDFWGKGRMIDWSDPQAALFIQDQRRYPNLVKKGVSVHWTDLGEPERFNPGGCYDGVETADGLLKNEHADLHNLYNLLWNRSIWNGYFDRRGQANDLGQTNVRPFILTRSGAAGTQRFGAAMWSGDIASNLLSLASHLNAQLHMSFSGIDYYGADTGGFRREVMPRNDRQGSYRGYQEELYTQWFANACWFDVPVRPHTDNEFNPVHPPYATSPHLVGKLTHNLANLRQRYELIPYYYSLAYRAHLAGEPLIAPLVVHYPADLNVREIGHEKLIGRDILVAAVARHGEYERNVYLPAGDWIDYQSNEWFHSTGQNVANLPAYRQGLFRLPVFVKSGALLPQMFVDAATRDAAGHRAPGVAPPSELIVHAYAATTASTFTLYEDDGRTLSYDAGARPRYHHRTTRLRQQQMSASAAKVEIGPAVAVGGGPNISGLANQRRNVVRLTVDNARATGVKLNGAPLPEQTSDAAFEAAASGWRNRGPNLIEAKSTSLSVATNKVFEFSLQAAPPVSSVHFVCDNGFTQPGESIYVSGNIPALGNSDPTQAIRLAPNVYYEYIWNPPPNPDGPGPSAPVWTGVVEQLPPATPFQWRCLRKRENGTGTPQLGPLQTFATSSGGYAGRTSGAM